MRINHNLSALNTYNQMSTNQSAASKSMEKLSSGLAINRSSDNAAGLSISEKMRGQIRGLEQASSNAQDGISLIQTAEGATNETHAILQRMRELAVQGSNDTNVTEDRTAIQTEMDALTEEITRIAEQTQFNKQDILNPAAGKEDVTVQVGANSGQTITISLGKMDATTLKVDALDVSDSTSAQGAIDSIDAAIESVSEFRSNLGATQNRLEHTINNLGTSAENLTAAESRIRDVDMAKEMMEMTKNNILQQAAQSMLAQANQNPQNILQLLR